MIRKIIRALPIIAAVAVWFALLNSRAYTHAPHHTQVKIVAIVAAAWLVAQIVAQAITRERRQQQSARQWQRPSYRTGRR